MERSGHRRLVCAKTLLPALMLALLGPAALCDAARAQEALFIRIRVHADPAAVGVAGSARAALAAREAVWERSNARARTVIESVCTGCLGPWAASAPQLVATAAVSEIAGARGVEPDRLSEASDATSNPSIHERRP